MEKGKCLIFMFCNIFDYFYFVVNLNFAKFAIIEIMYYFKI